MSMLTTPTNLSTLRDLLVPALYDMVGNAVRQRASTVKHAEIIINYVDDEMNLHVTHRLFHRGELDDGSFKRTFAGRVGSALGLKDSEPAKTIRVERRQLRWRGEQAARRAPRPIRSAPKRIAA